MIKATIGDEILQFMVDTGATATTLTKQPTGVKLSGKMLSTIGFSGITDYQPYTEPIAIKFGNQVVVEPVLIAKNCPVNLLARDILTKLGVRILCTPDGLIIQWPGQNKLPPRIGQFVVFEAPNKTSTNSVDVFWSRILHDSTCPGVLRQYYEWKPHITNLGKYSTPSDPFHVTYHYATNTDFEYEDRWDSLREGKEEDLHTTHIVVGPEGIAARVALTDEQLEWMPKRDVLVPHITLGVAEGYEACSLNKMMVRAELSTYTQVRDMVEISRDGQIQRFTIDAWDRALAEKVTRPRDIAGSNMNHVRADEMLATIPESLWTSHPHDVGRIEGEVVLTLKPTVTKPIWRAQYKLKPEQVEGIAETVTGLLRAGVLREAEGARWNTPILPVPKAGNKGWRMVHDLRLINEATTTLALPVPDPYVALRAITPEQKFFSVCDLGNAFFCLPLAEECQEWFSFTYGNKQYTYTRLAQGYKDSPGLFNQALNQILENMILPEGATIIQYVDDLLVATKTAEDSLAATKTLLMTLADAGFKVKREKCQITRRSVEFLGRIVGEHGTAMSDMHQDAILQYGKPKTVQDMLGFLGLCGYSRTYVPEYVTLTQPLREMVTEVGHRALKDDLNWTVDRDKAFQKVKSALSAAAHLASPNYEKDFYLDVAETEGIVNAVLYQRERGERKILSYFSCKLDSVEVGKPPCIRFLAALAKAIEKTAHIVLCHPLIVNTDHSVTALLASSAFSFSATRQIKIDDTLKGPHIMFKAPKDNHANMAKGVNGGGLLQHDCIRRVEGDSKLRENLHATPLDDPDWELFTDGCSYKSDIGNRAGYAVVKWDNDKADIIQAGEIPQPASAQVAEIKALTEALKLSAGHKVNIYTDSAYGFGAVHYEGPAWVRRKFLTAAGTPVKHEHHLRELIEALNGPTEVAVIKVTGHSKKNDKESNGNAAADAAAKLACNYPVKQCVTLRSGTTTSQGDYVAGNANQGDRSAIKYSEELEKLVQIQEASSPQEKREWVTFGAVRQVHEQEGKTFHIWRACTGQIVAPRTLLHALMIEAHGSTHLAEGKMFKKIKKHWWCPHLKEHIANFRAECDACNLMNPKRTIPHPLLKFPMPAAPWREICIDYTDMGQNSRTKDGYRYLLVAVDRFSRWVEAIPTKKEDAESVVRWLTTELIPRYGVPRRICSDNGTHFKNELLQSVEQLMGIKHRFGSVYKPESQGIVERANRTIKEKLAKTMAGTQLSWTEALPLVLMSMRREQGVETRLSPHEILTGREMPSRDSDPDWVINYEGIDTELSEYMKVLGHVVDLISQQVEAAHCKEGDEQQQAIPVSVGDKVYIKVKGRPHWSEPRWTGPYQVIQVTDRAVKTDRPGDSNWHHFAHCALVNSKRGKNESDSDCVDNTDPDNPTDRQH